MENGDPLPAYILRSSSSISGDKGDINIALADEVDIPNRLDTRCEAILATQAELRQSNLPHMPSLRSPVLRDPKKSLNLTRSSNEEAHLTQIVGQLAKMICDHCQRDKPCGPWKGCVVEEGYLGGSCANCTSAIWAADILSPVGPQATAASVSLAIDAAITADPFASQTTTRSTTARLAGLRSRQLPTSNLKTTPFDNASDITSASGGMASGQARTLRAERLREMAEHHERLAQLYRDEAADLEKKSMVTGCI